jgi:membrane associated rhomboid family serine protease
MIFPIGDTPNPRNFIAWVNWSFIAINLAVFVLITLPQSSRPADPRDPALVEYLRVLAPSVPPTMTYRRLAARISAYDVFVFKHGYKPGAPEVSDLFAAMFLHSGWLHLIGNMLFLWIYGDNVEHRLGRVGYVLTYLLTGVAATLIFALFAGRSLTPMIGASGAISGVLGLYFILFPRNRIKLFVAFFPFFFDTILVPARLVLGFYIVVDNVLPFLSGAQSNVAYGAHIGGFAVGLAIAWGGESVGWQWPWKDKLRRLGRPAKTPGGDVPDSPSALLLGELRTALGAGDSQRAIQALTMMERQDLAQLQPYECVQVAQWLDQAGHPVAATRLLRNCIASHPGAGNLADVYLVLGLMRLRQGQPTAAYQYLLTVFDHNPSAQTAAHARQALDQINVLSCFFKV